MSFFVRPSDFTSMNLAEFNAKYEVSGKTIDESLNQLNLTKNVVEAYYDYNEINDELSFIKQGNKDAKVDLVLVGSYFVLVA